MHLVRTAQTLQDKDARPSTTRQPLSLVKDAVRSPGPILRLKRVRASSHVMRHDIMHHAIVQRARATCESNVPCRLADPPSSKYRYIRIQSGPLDPQPGLATVGLPPSDTARACCPGWLRMRLLAPAHMSARPPAPAPTHRFARADFCSKWIACELSRGDRHRYVSWLAWGTSTSEHTSARQCTHAHACTPALRLPACTLVHGEEKCMMLAVHSIPQCRSGAQRSPERAGTHPLSNDRGKE